ncbi:MAG: phosphatase PAP2 family protein [Faecalibacterium sp.]|nr:phosphatase PAP2 family protein [Faecalibacterium sp.]
MKLKRLLTARPYLWFQLYWVVYLIWFFGLDWLIEEPKYIIHSPLDDLIPFCEWFFIPYCSWFFLLAGVTALLWWNDTEAYKKLCLMMFSGMTFCLIVYMIWPNGLQLRPDMEALGRQNLGTFVMGLLWGADDANNVCPSIHCQSSAAMALAFAKSKFGQQKPALRWVAWIWAALICASTVFTKQHSVIDIICGVALVLPWYVVLYCRPKQKAL